MHGPPDSTEDAGDEARADLRYDCDRTRLPPALAGRFVTLACDDAARAFLATTGRAPHGAVRTGAYRVLRRFMADFDAYGLLGMYRVHLLSTAQLRALLALDDGTKVAAWLDVGAGNGAAIEAARPLLSSLHATEASTVLARKLRSQGVHVHDVDLCQASIDAPGAGFDVVSLFNVLDRCLHPRTMLQHAIAALRPGGTLLVALALPLQPHVDMGSHSVDQEQPLPIDDDDPSWEAGAARLWTDFIAPAGLSLSALARVPYLSQGDAATPLHVLDDALFVCRRVV